MLNIDDNIFVRTIHDDRLEYELTSTVQHLSGEGLKGHYQSHVRVDSDSSSGSNLKFIKVSDSSDFSWSSLSDVRRSQMFFYKLSKVHLNCEENVEQSDKNVMDEANMMVDDDYDSD